MRRRDITGFATIPNCRKSFWVDLREMDERVAQSGLFAISHSGGNSPDATRDQWRPPNHTRTPLWNHSFCFHARRVRARLAISPCRCGITGTLNNGENSRFVGTRENGLSKPMIRINSLLSEIEIWNGI